MLARCQIIRRRQKLGHDRGMERSRFFYRLSVFEDHLSTYWSCRQISQSKIVANAKFSLWCAKGVLLIFRRYSQTMRGYIVPGTVTITYVDRSLAAIAESATVRAD